jgi:hypothetical protein
MLWEQQRYLCTTTISFEALASENCTTWHELIPLLQASALHPGTTRSEALIGYTTTPVRISDDGTLPVDGVLISG